MNDDPTRSDTQADPLAPLGKSVEEVEASQGNRRNPEIRGEQLRRGGDLPPIPVLSGPSSTPLASGGTTGVNLNNEEGADSQRSDRGRGEEVSDNSTS